jgi:hypothetical protein
MVKKEVIKIYKDSEGKIAYEIPSGMSGTRFLRLLIKYPKIKEAKKGLLEDKNLFHKIVEI